MWPRARDVLVPAQQPHTSITLLIIIWLSMIIPIAVSALHRGALMGRSQQESRGEPCTGPNLGSLQLDEVRADEDNQSLSANQAQAALQPGGKVAYLKQASSMSESVIYQLGYAAHLLEALKLGKR